MLALHGLEFAWTPHSVLRFADFEIAQGKAVLLVGPSGAADRHGWHRSPG